MTAVMTAVIRTTTRTVVLALSLACYFCLFTTPRRSVSGFTFSSRRPPLPQPSPDFFVTVRTRSNTIDRRRRFTERSFSYNDDYDDDYEEVYDDDEEYEEYDDDDDDDDDDDTEREDLWSWESCGAGTDVLLPPVVFDDDEDDDQQQQQQQQQRPRLPDAVLHFVGGTFFGSLPPRASYRSFLEGVAERHGNVVVVASSVPVLRRRRRRGRDEIAGLPYAVRSPLDHDGMASSIRRDLRRALRDVVDDEYGRGTAESLPLVGVGHSLGARLQLLSYCERRSGERSDSGDNDGGRQTRTTPTPTANVLMAFNNWNAVRSVPLLDKVRSVFEGSKGIIDRYYRNRSSGEEGEGRRISRPPPRWNNENDDDERTKRRRRRGRTRTENDGDAFEFIPSPEALWSFVEGASENATTTTTARRSYDVARNLLIQFDRDDLDQSVELAHRLTTGRNDMDGLKFATLRGNHLLPCGGGGGGLLSPGDDASATRKRRRRRGSDNEDDDDSFDRAGSGRSPEMEDLISTVVSYVRFVAPPSPSPTTNAVMQKENAPTELRTGGM